MSTECSICEEEISESDDLVTTDCNHTFHRLCAQDRLHNKSKADCHYCHQESMLGDALARLTIISEGDCSICENPWTLEDDIITTDCNHTFHYRCAQDRLDTRNKSDCHYCHQESALGNALSLKNSKINGECSICENEWNAKDNVITTTCNHTFHRICAQARLDNKKRTDCHCCHQESAIGDALSGNKTTVIMNKSVAHISILKPSTDTKTDPSTSKRTIVSHRIEKFENKWKCEECSNENQIAWHRCGFCGQPKNGASPTFIPPIERQEVESRQAYNRNIISMKPTSNDQSKSLYSKLSDPMDVDPSILTNSAINPIRNCTLRSTTNAYLSKQVLQPVTVTEEEYSSDDKNIVYISDLPLSIYGDIQLHQVIEYSLEKTLQIRPISIQCYAKLGVGFMHVSNKQIKNRLIEDIKKMVIDVSGGTHVISFSDVIEVVSYIVIDTTNEKTDINLPNVDEVRKRWTELFKGEKSPSCDRIDSQFPNIFRIVSTSLDDVLDATSKSDFLIKRLVARVYISADCSYFEDLPRSITKEQLETAICSSMGLKNAPSSSLHIELNKQMNNACIIASDQARMWSTKSFIYLDGKPKSKKEHLACRLRIHPILEIHSNDEILNSAIFEGKASIIEARGQHLILEISNKNIFDNCLAIGVLSPKNKPLLKMELYSTLSNPENCELDCETWYRFEMILYKPDIMQFIADLNHPIFYYKWNAHVWLQEFQNSKSQNHIRNINLRPQSNISSDQIRHLLQMSVMLNTIGVIKKKTYTLNDKPMTLSLDPGLKTIVYNHDSLLELGRSIKLTQTTHAETKVVVVNDDCVNIYEKYCKKYNKPLLLNMASATSPGGGYKKGDGAQEENLFRRSDYFRSLDIELDFIQDDRSERFYCSNNNEILPLTDHTTMYPMTEYGAIYTSGLTFFRHSEDKGYEYMEKPLQGVYALAMAAYRNPKLDGNMLSPKYAVGMRKKIENLFAIAVHQKHDCLILSAFGCGAFRNPPEHVAKLFLSVIEQYAGFFEMIVFAIIDDHNSGQQHNLEGNFKLFKDELDGFNIKPQLSLKNANTIVGPYRILSDGSSIQDVKIFYIDPCQYGARCKDMYDENHAENYSHPTLCKEQCLTGTCTKLNDSIHKSFFIHHRPCKHGAHCPNIDDVKHSKDYEHPSYCPSAAKCQDISDDHEKAYRHLPTCKQFQKCIEYQKHTVSHCEKFRHYTPRCNHGSYCAEFHDKKHIEAYQHPFPTPCPYTPYHCSLHEQYTLTKHPESLSDEINQHCLNFAHVCEFGRNCRDKCSLHWEKYIHVPRCICPTDNHCTKLAQEDHLNSFTHSGIRDIRFLCKYADKCKDRLDSKHVSRFRHIVTLEDSGIVRYYNLNENINFVENQKDNIERVMKYIKKEKWAMLPSRSLPPKIIDWIRTVRPVHRCRPEIFESIILHGHVMSREYMDQLNDSNFVAMCVFQHSRIQQIRYIKEKECAKNVKEYIQALVANEFKKTQPAFCNIAASIKSGTGSAGITNNLTYQKNVLTKVEVLLSGTLKEDDIKTIEKTAIEIAQASIKLHSNPAGIGYAPDKDLGTNRSVFTVLGPHLGHYYGDVFIVFKREILHHPDANFSMQAATSYASGNCFKWRPWLGTVKSSKEERIKVFHDTKLHASVPGYEYSTALELIALTSLELNKKSMNIDLTTIIDRWLCRDSHQNIEAHLPQLIPLDYIEHIYMSQTIFDSLSHNARQFIDNFFKDSITKTKHKIEIDQKGGNFGSNPSTSARVEYQNFVVKDIMRKFDEDDIHSMSRPIRGTIITISGTELRDPYVLPLTIDQAFEQYKINHPQVTNAVKVYIYWQIMNGDMMLTLSNEQINTGEKQPHLRCLTCYIAEKPSTVDTHYHEQVSYLHSGGPFQHEIVIKEHRYAAKSTSFFIGCNTDDFMTFCLEIDYSTRRVTLSHAGPNSIYNHEKISAVFPKSNLDVNELNYIHVSSGVHTVPIRNLIITFEKQPDLHPTFDKTFDVVSSSLAAQVSSPHANEAHSLVTSVDETVSNDNKTSSIVHQIVDKACELKDKFKGFIGGSAESSLTPCRDGIDCLLQYSSGASTHNETYSHPCRFSELCQKKEPYLTHEPHRVPQCALDKKCQDLCNPVHRAQYRHTGWPDFLIPCRDQGRCRERSEHHLSRYSHGEHVFKVIDRIQESDSSQSVRRKSHFGSNERLRPCKWSTKCYDISAEHRAKFSHP